MPQPIASALPLKEIGLIALCALALYVFLAIVSYSPMDPAWSFAGTDLTVSNLVGASGAWSADVMFFALGWIAYALPIALAAGGVRLVAARAEPWSWPLFGIRLGGWTAVIVAATVLARLHFADPGELPAGSGGVIGDWLVMVGMPVLNWIGLTLIALAVLLVGAQSALGYSWLGVAEVTGRGLHRFAMFVFVMTDRTLAAARDLRRRKPAIVKARAKRAAPRREANEKPKPAPKVEKAPAAAVAPKSRQQRLFDMQTPGELPDLGLLDEETSSGTAGYSDESLEAMSRLLEIKLRDFGVDAEVVSVLPGPVITRFELQPAAGVKVSKISALAKDLARSLAVISVRIVEVIPGKSVVGIEIPNERREVVRLKDVLSSKAYQESTSPLTLALGKDIAGAPVMTDIAKMPHLLVAGTTGSGKSVGVNAMLLSMLYKTTPDELRLILVDPKMLELAVYDGIPHLLTPVVTDMKEAAQALNWCVAEMERRYQLMAALGVRNLAGFNRRVAEAEKAGKPLVDPLRPQVPDTEPHHLGQLPFIVVVIDEFADMMMIVGKKVEQLIARIAQKARAAGIHLVLATQRPSVDVITGLIKANIPTRISYQVSSKVDSRTILDQGGAEQLLGHGDMLYLPPGTAVPVRVHGAFVSDHEVHNVVADWKKRGAPDYLAEVLEGNDAEADLAGLTGDTESDEPLYDEAVQFVLESRRASISAVQRKLRIGYNRAARLIEAMEQAGLVSEMNSNGTREVLVPHRD